MTYGHPGTAAEAEANVERARADLSATLDQLRDNLQPSHLVQEAMARPRDVATHWLAVFNRFATHSPLARLIIGAAALLMASSLARRGKGRR